MTFSSSFAWSQPQRYLSRAAQCEIFIRRPKLFTALDKQKKHVNCSPWHVVFLNLSQLLFPAVFVVLLILECIQFSVPVPPSQKLRSSSVTVYTHYGAPTLNFCARKHTVTKLALNNAQPSTEYLFRTEIELFRFTANTLCHTVYWKQEDKFNSS